MSSETIFKRHWKRRAGALKAGTALPNAWTWNPALYIRACRSSAFRIGDRKRKSSSVALRKARAAIRTIRETPFCRLGGVRLSGLLFQEAAFLWLWTESWKCFARQATATALGRDLLKTGFCDRRPEGAAVVLCPE